MPIREENIKRYPANWLTEIVPAIRARAGNRCESCGVPNRVFVIREIVLGAIVEDSWRAASCEKDARQIATWWKTAVLATTGIIPNLHGPIEIVLTTAHVDDSDPANCDPENLRYLCQLAHNRANAQERADNRKIRETAARVARQNARILIPEGTTWPEQALAIPETMTTTMN